jgi:hypothetical protein
MLSASQRQEFETRGFVRLPRAFAKEAAQAMEARVWRWLEKQYGTRRDDRASWSGAPVCGMQGLKREAVFEAIGSEATCAALDDLLGTGRWKRPREWGQFLVGFPSAGEWSVPSHVWHTDFGFGSAPEVPVGALVVSFLSDVPPGGGGTVVAVGAHRLLRDFLAGRPAAGREKMKRTREAFLSSHPWFVALSSQTPGIDRVETLMRRGACIGGVEVRVEELSGEAGDVVFGHPWLLHASAPNGGDSPRIMRVQRVQRAAHPVAEA